MLTKDKYDLLKDDNGLVFISLTDDLLFKASFGFKKNKRFLEALLESYFNFSDGFLKDKLISNYEYTFDKAKYLDKSIRSDLVVYFDNMIINIEMYKVFNEEALSKSNYYIMRIETNQIGIGDDYKAYSKITQINFLGKDNINVVERISSNINIGEIKAEQVFIHLDKPEQYLYNQSERFYKFVKLFNAKSYEERDLIAKGDELLMEFNNWVKDYCQEGEEKYFNDVYWNERIQRLEGHKEGKKEGLKEGHKEGKKEEQTSIAKRMLDETTDLGYISRMTELSIEEIAKLKEE